jgi:hypothetical protein
MEIEGMAPSVMEWSSEDEDDVMDTDPPPLSVGARRGLLSSQFNEESEWEEGSTNSDASMEGLLCEDDDDIVPRSFNLPAPPSPSSNEDRLESDDELPVSFSESTEEDLHSSACVFGSDSGYLLAAFATLG